ncbi:hypothetical protein CAOG_04132 [Capsaspora owczarzaki ATCC 30864]|uniref:SGNH hydrolase-type esterase domain-containing protein n=1 Tax=Capsaspora owczarzaki (strain ATCC 30864) TaxID=595528 RepID=A0A0D2VR58_CAPO3|nr:hypothetical protein CAOG_04132 [Capsaspora owczarzaki ATCC 30864]KJE93327.1 hypothetical protein CAOG_004132 [Capsaspora owczarzaki ATCC 30864]|eukprot:XP_004347957.1 hypothetical protein CAOG_04132 [Capsaspora owczarzaki ATCC 30864]
MHVAQRHRLTAAVWIVSSCVLVSILVLAASPVELRWSGGGSGDHGDSLKLDLSYLLQHPNRAVASTSASIPVIDGQQGDTLDSQPITAMLGVQPIGLLGRFDGELHAQKPGSAVVFGWSGFEINAMVTGASSIAAVMAGPQLAAKRAGLDPELPMIINNTREASCQFNVYIDGIQLHPAPPTEAALKLTSDALGARLLASNLDETSVHSIRIVKRTELQAASTAPRQGACAFYGLLLTSQGRAAPRLLPPPRPAVFAHGAFSDHLNAMNDVAAVSQSLLHPVRLEFYGDSITVGFGALDRDPCKFSFDTEDIRASYATKVTKALLAEAHYIARSGIGLIRSRSTEPTTVMKEIAHLSLGGTGATPWDYANFTPDLAFFNLGTNDFRGWGDNGPVFVAAFIDEYESLIQRVRAAHHQPNLPVYLLCGPMDLPPVACDAIKDVATRVGGKYIDVTDTLDPSEYGCRKHPSESSNVKVAARVLDQVKQDFPQYFP